MRDDLDGLPLQVGLWQGSFSADIHTADFDNFSIRIAPDPTSLSAPRPGGTSARVARKEGTVSFWMRRDPSEERKEMLWDRPLTLAEARHQFRSAKGKTVATGTSLSRSWHTRPCR
jgi:hypothetical protein